MSEIVCDLQNADKIVQTLKARCYNIKKNKKINWRS